MVSEPETLFSVVIPVYNEQARLGSVLEEVFGYLNGFGESYEVVMVDDGSRDRTQQILEEWGTRQPRLRVLRLPYNQGKGEAIRQGMLHATGRYRLFRDADLSTRMEEMNRFRPLLDGKNHVVIGSRRVRGAIVVRHQAFLREFLGKGFTLLCRPLFVWEVLDYTCGFKCFSAQAAMEIFSRQRTRRWAFDAEILFLAKRLGYSIVQMPVTWADEAGSKVRMGLDVLRSLREIGCILFYYLSGAYRLSLREKT